VDFTNAHVVIHDKRTGKVLEMVRQLARDRLSWGQGTIHHK
jgi:hypothetical protein